MKNLSFTQRLSFAWSGIRKAWSSEKSFRTQSFLGAGALGALFVLRPAAIWWAVFLLAIGAVLAAELINTSLEQIADRLHPDTHPKIEMAKDCAAGAVLVLSLAALGVLIVLLLTRW